jgi:glucosyl-dolichyl phosphate glucuronosyltransferase
MDVNLPCNTDNPSHIQLRRSVVIATYNRAESLLSTLRSLSEVGQIDETEVIVVDNNSNDHTKDVVEKAAAWFPKGLHYIFEPEQGRSAALNSGILASGGEIILITDDDVMLDVNWICAAERALELPTCDYVGGRVLPIWQKERPRWLPNRGGKHWAVIGLLDYGAEMLKLGSQVPLGVNMAFRRDAFARAGMWNNQVGRRGMSLLGQEVREWGLRARAAGLSGFYIPDMVVHHIIPSDRLTKKYFRRWFYWHGVSRAILFEISQVDMESPEETTLDFSKVSQIAGVPRYMYRSCLLMFTKILSSAVRRDVIATFENELWLWFFAGILAQRWKDRRRISGLRSNYSERDPKEKGAPTIT